MKLISNYRCVIGEGPIWNETEGRLYYTNGLNNEICMLDVYTGKLDIRNVGTCISAFAFTKDNRLIVSKSDGVFILKNDNSTELLYDTEKYKIKLANDMKVGPDGKIYVGTQAEKRAGISDKVDGKLYSIDSKGNVKVLLDNLMLSNGLEWSIDERFFYHTDSYTQTIKEYSYDKEKGDIKFTGRVVDVAGVDGFTVDQDNNILVACWACGHIAVIDTKKLKITSYIDVPAGIPTSCSFAGRNMELLTVVTANYDTDIIKDVNAGFTFGYKPSVGGRKPYLFG